LLTTRAGKMALIRAGSYTEDRCVTLLDQVRESSFTGLNTACWWLGYLLEIPFAAMVFERHLTPLYHSPRPGSSSSTR
jgi:hypothetical protein